VQAKFVPAQAIRDARLPASKQISYWKTQQMNKVTKRFVSLTTLILALSGSVLADQITLKNGDRVTGKMINLTAPNCS